MSPPIWSLAEGTQASADRFARPEPATRLGDTRRVSGPDPLTMVTTQATTKRDEILLRYETWANRFDAIARRRSKGTARIVVEAPARPTQLSPRELDVLQLVADGLQTAEIGGALGISEQTVISHVSAARIKLGARNRAHAVAIAFRQALLSSDEPALAA